MEITPSKIYKILLKEFGNLNWWPMDKRYHEINNSDPRFEIIVGAILTQNTTWVNVEKALNNIKTKNLLDINNISDIDNEILPDLIKPSGYFNQKSKRLKILAEYIKDNFNGNLDVFFNRKLHEIRNELLSLNGIGPETADSILLYAGNFSIIVVDAYTKRICQRLPIKVDITYQDIQNYFQSELSKEYTKKELNKVFNELHAQIVILGKTYCKKKPDCMNCPLKKICNFKKQLSK
jgi:endonuclease-3 related protein